MEADRSVGTAIRPLSINPPARTRSAASGSPPSKRQTCAHHTKLTLHPAIRPSCPARVSGRHWMRPGSDWCRGARPPILPVMRTLLIAGAVLVVVAVLLYNRLIGRRNQADYALASVDALLKKRHDLVPNLVAAVRGYMDHEREVLERVTEARARAGAVPIGTAERLQAETSLVAALSGLLIRVEAYPELRASANVLQLQAALNEVEEQISAARRFFNAAVADYNNAIEMFPSNLMASAARLTRRPFFEIPQVERAAPRAALGE